MAVIDVQINPEPINTLNFLRWHEPNAGTIAVASFIGSGLCLEEYTADLRPESPCKIIATNDEDIYAIPMVYQDNISFAVNADKDLGAAENLALHLLKGSTLTAIPGQSLAYVFEAGKKYLTGAFPVPCANDGQYNLVLISNGQIILVSNPVRIMNYQSSQHPTVFADFRHTVSQFGYPYSTATTFRNRFRINALLTVPRPAETISTYEDRNRDTRFIGKGTLSRYSDFKTDHLDAATHEAISAMFLHNDLKLNGRAYRKADSYETELETDTFNLYQGATRVKDLTFTQMQNNC